jgi:dehydrogenase/reductase SDR family protein 12
MYSREALLQGAGAATAENGAEGVGFYSMHPGWADTDAVRAALPGFYETLKAKLRSPEMGSDTVAWLCVVGTIMIHADC